jgi:Family of unknown function (DUF5956)
VSSQRCTRRGGFAGSLPARIARADDPLGNSARECGDLASVMNTHGRWSEFRVLSAPERVWFELPESGFGALVAWLAGPRNAFRIRSDRSQATVVVTLGDPVTGSSYERPFTADEGAEIDNDIDLDLHDAGVPPRLRGFSWYIRPPSSHITEQDFWSIVHGRLALLGPDRLHFSDTATELAAILRELYANEG